jgi:hypothetical protein
MEVIEKLQTEFEATQIIELTKQLSPIEQFGLLLDLLAKADSFKLPDWLDSEILSFSESNHLDISILAKFNKLADLQRKQWSVEQQSFYEYQIEMKSFENWKFSQVNACFDLKRQPSLARLEEWLNVDIEMLSDAENNTLIQLQEDLRAHTLAWNEATLKFEFIAPLLKLIRYQHPNYQPFAEAILRVEADLQKLPDFLQHRERLHLTEKDTLINVSGKVDYLLASGEQDPIAPYFCLHEYKREKGNEADPLGQLLIAMVSAKTDNEIIGTNIPIFGAYVQGRYWNFVVMQNDEYAVSLSYDATKDEIFTIARILKKLQRLLQNYFDSSLKP